MSVAITGWRSRIAVEFRALLPRDEAIRGTVGSPAFSTTADRYLFCHGLLRPKMMAEQTPEERAEGLRVNYLSVVEHCDAVLAKNPAARICIIGSESGYRGSFDGTYAAAKAALHAYVEHKVIGPEQQLVAISPGIIADAGMTTRRTDRENLERRRAEHPKRRFLESREVAEVAHFLLYRAPYISGTVVRMHGGQS